MYGPKSRGFICKVQFLIFRINEINTKEIKKINFNYCDKFVTSCKNNFGQEIGTKGALWMQKPDGKIFLTQFL